MIISSLVAYVNQIADVELYDAVQGVRKDDIHVLDMQLKLVRSARE